MLGCIVVVVPISLAFLVVLQILSSLFATTGHWCFIRGFDEVGGRMMFRELLRTCLASLLKSMILSLMNDWSGLIEHSLFQYWIQVIMA